MIPTLRRCFHILPGLAVVIALSACTSVPVPQITTPDTAGGKIAVKLITAREGPYAISAQRLAQAGFDTASPGEWQLSHRSQARPFWVEGEGQDRTLHFYAAPETSQYSSEGVYWLSAQGASEAAAPAPSSDETGTGSRPWLDLPDGAYLAVSRWEQNELYNPDAPAGDRWFWQSYTAPQTASYEAGLDGLVPGEGRIRAAIWASTAAPVDPDHHLRLHVNGQVVIDLSWDGAGRREIEGSLPAGLLQEGSNHIEIDAPGDTGVPADIVLLDWIEIEYPRLFTPVEDRLEFTGTGSPLALDAFSGPVRIYDITEPNRPALVDPGGKTFAGEVGRRYLVVGPQGYRSPLRVEPAVLTPDLRAAGAGGDYVAIGPQDLLEPLHPLFDLRRRQGLHTVAVPSLAIFDQFGAGYPEPEAIHNFLRFAAATWQPAPRFVLLAGDATYDPKGYLDPAGGNRLPTFFIETGYGGETASDVAFAQLDDDLLPDIAIGRLPARTPAQVTTWVAKTLAFEQAADNGSGNGWRQRVLAVADGQDPAFQDDAQRFLDALPAAYERELLAPPPGQDGAGRQLIERVQQGGLLVAYFGHGSLNMWGKDRLFTIEDVEQLSNGERTPLVVNVTCLTGLFTHPQAPSLAEALLWKENGGAVVVLAPTSLTLPADQSFLSQPLAEALFAAETPTVGEALLQARRQTPAAPGAQEVMQTFLLFGDPALRLLDLRTE